MSHSIDSPEELSDSIAVIGMAGRFPDAPDLETFWQNLRGGVESISRFSEEELRKAGVPEERLERSSYVRAAGRLEDVDEFDAEVFGFNPREAEILDPQHRVFLEVVLEAFNHAGHDPFTDPSLIGIWAGAGSDTYFKELLQRDPSIVATYGEQLWMGNDKDFLATRVAYKLDLRGPAINLQTACSTSLVATCRASQALLDYQCDMAVAGGVSIYLFRPRGYRYQPEGIMSPDGVVRAFDADAEGSVPSNGAGAVILRRLEDALEDGDRILAVLRGWSVGNDGAARVGFSAPGVQGQAEAIEMAQALADVEPGSIDYVETHGSGTPLGDSIEVAALRKAFDDAAAAGEAETLLGSLKTNVGHMDAAAGVGGLIKTTLCLQHETLVPSLHFEEPNPKTGLEKSRFTVSTETQPWTRGETPRRAGVSSFGIGGTNAHVVIEEAPAQPPSDPGRRWQLLTVSARGPDALEAAAEDLAEHLADADPEDPETYLADVAFTTQVGRPRYEHRRMVVVRDLRDAARTLEESPSDRVVSRYEPETERPVVFLFPGLGEHYLGMGRGLYETEPVFRRELDRCAELLEPKLDVDLRTVLFESPDEPDRDDAEEGMSLKALLGRSDEEPENLGALRETRLAQPAVFAVEYALARLWMSRGIRPKAMLGYSIGEYVAACLAGVLDLESALTLVAERARRIQELPGGSMLAVSLPEEGVEPFLTEGVAVAAVNGPSMCVVAGEPEAVEALRERLEEQDVPARPVPTTHAFHTPQLEPAVEAVTRCARDVSADAPEIPYLSNVTGTWIRPREARDPGYWGRHMCRPVRFSEGLDALMQRGDPVLLEVGPGQGLSSLALQHPAVAGSQRRISFPSMRHVHDRRDDRAVFLEALGRLWLEGAAVDWSRCWSDEHRRRVPLPSYPFQRRRYWLGGDGSPETASESEKNELADWFYLPSWLRTAMPVHIPEAGTDEELCWLVLEDEIGLGRRLAQRLRDAGHRVVTAAPGQELSRQSADRFLVPPGSPGAWNRLARELEEDDLRPSRLVHLGTLDGSDETKPGGFEDFRRAQRGGYWTLLGLIRAFGGGNRDLQLDVVADRMVDVTEDDPVQPEKATLLGASKVIPQEYPNVTVRFVDVETEAGEVPEPLLERLVVELETEPEHSLVAYRGGRRWVRRFEPLRLESREPTHVPLLQKGVYLLVGGLGRIGLELAEFLAREWRARLVLTGRSDPAELPEERRERLQALEDAGVQVLARAVDGSDEEAMEALLDEVEERFGGLDGAIYLAADLDPAGFQSIQETTEESTLRHFRAKVEGLYVLRRVLAGRPLDFCLVYSSLASVLGGLDYFAYAAANRFQDAFATAAAQRSGVPWMSVDWDTWNVEEAVEESVRSLSGPERHLVMTPAEGIEAFRRVLSVRRLRRIVVSLSDLDARLSRWARPSAASPEGDPGDEADATERHPRPHMETDYAEPSNDIEARLVPIWEEVLGIDGIGVDDHFFQLGGHSLMGIRIVARVRETFDVDLPVRALFEAPTVARLGELIVEARSQEADPDELEDLLGEIEGLEDDEIEAVLAGSADD